LKVIVFSPETVAGISTYSEQTVAATPVLSTQGGGNKSTLVLYRTKTGTATFVRQQQSLLFLPKSELGARLRS
jgi:hypothetical protein